MRFPSHFISTLFLAAACQCAWAGTVRTIDGQTLSGAVSIDLSGQLIVNQPDTGITRIKPADVLEATFSQETQPPRLHEGVVLSNGTAIAATIMRVDDSSLVYQRANKQVTVPIGHVARIILDSAAADLLPKIPPGQTGVLLTGGDFVQGDVTGISDGQVRITSVLFGIGSYAMGKEAVAVVLGTVQPAKTDWVVEMADGSVLMAASLKFAQGEVVFDDLTQGTFIASAIGLYSYRIGPGRQTSLLTLKSDPPLDEQIQPQVPAELRGSSNAAENISMSAGASATYHLKGKYRAFTCRLGVSSRLAPSAPVQFVITADGTELAHTNGRTSIDDPLLISVPVSGVKDLVLKINGSVGPDLGAAGIWSDPCLIRQ